MKSNSIGMAYSAIRTVHLSGEYFALARMSAVKVCIFFVFICYCSFCIYLLLFLFFFGIYLHITVIPHQKSN